MAGKKKVVKKVKVVKASDPFIIKDIEELKMIYDTYMAIQKMRILSSNRIGGISKSSEIPKDRSEEIHNFIDGKLHMFEKSLVPPMEAYGITHPVWQEWLVDVRGIGPTLWAGLMAYIRDVGRYSTLSKMYAYLGLSSMYYKAECEKGHKHLMMHDPIVKKDACNILIDEEGAKCGSKYVKVEKVEGEAPRKIRGYHIHWNPDAKTLMWKVSDCLIKCGSKYKTQIYDHYKAKELAAHPEFPPWRVDVRAKRKMIKIFLSHLWEVWRKSAGLPYEESYAVAYKQEEKIEIIRDKNDM